MEKFIKENWFKVGVILVVLIIIGLAAYFYNKQITLGVENQRIVAQEKQNELVQKCAVDGKKYFQEYQAQNNDQNIIWDGPEFHYNNKLGACLLWFRYIDQGSKIATIQHNQITNLSSNKIILLSDVSIYPDRDEIIPSYNTERPSISRNDFFKQKQALMSE